MNDARCEGVVFDVEHFAVHDGPGIRTTVFLKGCPMECIWCHNPESISPDPQLLFTERLCMACGKCREVCPRGAHRIGGGRHEIDRLQCAVCGACAGQCYAGALEVAGVRRTAADVIEDVLRDLPFYKNSGGGMTLSGGEPLAQAAFAETLLGLARLHHVHTALDTSGFASWETLWRLADASDLILYDLKHMDNPQHIACTGVSNERILENLRRLDAVGRTIWVRIPLIPGRNDTEANAHALGEFLRKMNHVERIEVLRYHRFAESKYERIGKDYSLRGLAGPDMDSAQQWCCVLAQYGLPRIVCR